MAVAVDPPRVDYHEYLRSPQWRARRREALWAADYACTSCGSVERLDVHHVSYDRLGRELPEDLRVLCRPCHDREHEALEQERWWARVEGWGRKVYSPTWTWKDWAEYERVERAFVAWLDQRGEGASVPVWEREALAR